MEHKNNLDKVPLANIKDKELREIKDLEEKLGDQYYLIAFDKNNMK